MASTQKLEDILSSLALQPGVKEELLDLVGNDSRTSEETARLKELFDALENELEAEFGALALRDAFEQKVDERFEAVNAQFERDVAVATKLSDAEALFEQKQQQQDDVDEARKELENL